MQKFWASRPRNSWLVRSVRPAAAALLCTSLLSPAEMPAATSPAPHLRQKPAKASTRLTGQQRALHALNRFSFGPTPGEVAEVQRQGVEAWFEQQLHPEQIADSALTARLAAYPAMQLNQADLIERFPTYAMLRQYNNGVLASPNDPVEHAIWADAALNFAEKKAEKKAGASLTQSATSQPAGSQSGAAPIERRSPATPSAGRATMAAASDDTGSDDPNFGPAQVRALSTLPPADRFARLVALTPGQMQTVDANFRGPGLNRLTAGMTPLQTEQVRAMRTPERVVQDELPEARLVRDVYSQRQLEAVMTDFWLNHFNVYQHKNRNEPYLLPAFERDAIRAHAFGRFEDLLVATAESPAMLVYLDNAESVGPDSRAGQSSSRAAKDSVNPNAVPLKKKADKGINENYARELMELHTLGVNGGYTQADVIEVAKCFTGWTIDRPGQGDAFVFNPNRHEPGDKVVLGHTIHEGGMNEGLEVLHLLANSPATAHFISLELAQRFVSDAPPTALVDRLSAAYLRSDGDIRTVLLTLFHTPEFWSPGVYRAKVKTPLEFAVSTLRATGAEMSDPGPMVGALAHLGMPLYGMQTPNGYSWQAEDWVSSNALLTRMNFALVFSANRLGGTTVRWPALAGTTAAPGAAEDAAASEPRLELALLGQPATPQTRNAVLAGAHDESLPQAAAQSFWEGAADRQPKAAGKQGKLGPARFDPVAAGRGAAQAALPADPLATTAGLLLGSPDFQRR